MHMNNYTKYVSRCVDVHYKWMNCTNRNLPICSFVWKCTKKVKTCVLSCFLQNNMSHPFLAMFYYALHYLLSPVIHRYTGKHSKRSGSSLLPLFPCKWSQSDPRDEYPGKKTDQMVKGMRIGLKNTHKPIQTILSRNAVLHTCEQKEISLKLFSMATFLVSGLTKKIWDLPT